MSLDGSIAGPNGEADWIVINPEIDFPNMMARFDTVLMGWRTFEAAQTQSGGGEIAGITSVVVSGTLRPADYSGVTVLSEDVGAAVSRLRVQPRKDIWLFGGGSLFRSPLDLGLVDTVEVAIVPVLLGGGIPLLPPGSERSSLRLLSSKVYKATGAVRLEYSVEQQQAEPDAAPAPVAQGGSGGS